MPNAGPASVIVSTYNDADILELSLAALAAQSFSDFELILADDGSTQNYAPFLQKWALCFAHGIQHVTHEKHGFRRARILNRAIRVSRFDFLIFLDMDCLAHRDFVRNHLHFLEPGTVITGRRADLSRDAAPQPFKISQQGLSFRIHSLLLLWLRGKARRVEHGFVSPALYESSYTDLLGSNFSIRRSDMLALNGFNEDFEGWGGEDTELDVRLRLHGIRVRNLRNKVVEYHLRHPRREETLQRTQALIERTKNDEAVRARIGLSEIRQGDFSVELHGAAKPGDAPSMRPACRSHRRAQGGGTD